MSIPESESVSDGNLIVSVYSFTVPKVEWIHVPRIDPQDVDVPSLPEDKQRGYWVEGEGGHRKVHILTSSRLGRFAMFEAE